MLWAILNKSWWQHPTRHQLYGHLPPSTKTIQDRRTRHARHCWRSKDELITAVLQWTPTYGWARAGRPARTNIQQVCEDTGCSPEDLSEAMNDWEKWRERVRDIRACVMTWWWWYIYIYLCHCVFYLLQHQCWQTVRTEFLFARFTSIYRQHFIITCCGLQSTFEHWWNREALNSSASH